VKPFSPRAIVDIGSNSVRLVIFGGPARAPIILHNEKVVAGLGRGVIADGQLTRAACDMALEGLRRFALTIKAMNASPTDVVATAAVRNASNGAAFAQEVHALGLPVRILSGEEEAIASGMGVISANPMADGIAADLGGGSLELVRIKGGAVLQRTSLPIGILNVAAIRAESKTALRQSLDALVRPLDWVKDGKGLPLHLVGGSWRALARIHRHHADAAGLPLDQYSFAPGDVAELAQVIARSDKAQLRAIPGMPSGRVALAADACALLAALVAVLAPSDLVTCAFGLREGLLYQALDEETRALDPLIEGVRFATEPVQPVPGQADALMGWLDGLFDDEPPAIARLRHAACLIAGQGWLIGPEARAADGAAMALHGKWIGITVRERAMVAMAVQIAAGEGEAGLMSTAPLLGEDDLLRARRWGQAMRLAGRLAGGAPSVLQRSRAEIREGQLQISLPHDLAVLGNAAFQRRADTLAASWGLSAARIKFS
jgi:exopolyphosphatase/guanosine-5'-triphosphate,3'-diphosphate pyrophosphatase